MQTAYDGQQWAAPSDVGAQGGFPASAAAAAGVHGVPDIPARLPSGEPIPIGEQLMQVDQAITLTLQEIDANFARTHQAITARILPSIKRYGVASHNTWQGAKFWHRFFEAASDIHLAPPRDELDYSQRTATEGESSTSYAADRTDDRDQSGLTDNVAEARRGDNHAMQGDTTDESGELVQEHFEPPRLSDASIAATARLSRNTLQTSGDAGVSERGVGFDDDDEASYDFDLKREDNGATPPDKRDWRRQVHSGEQSNRDQSKRSAKALKVQATPRRGAKAHNPFTEATQDKMQGSSSSNRSSSPSRWDGIADLRKTPLVKVNRRDEQKVGGSSLAKGKSAADDVGDDSLAWPAGMSPPVTMQFSVPRSRYNKTPAKEAARLVVDDLLRTVEGTTPAARRRLMQEKEAAAQGRSPSDVRLKAVTSGLAGTPLGSGKGKPTKGRLSMPTPPTITKRVTGSRSTLAAQRESTPKAAAGLPSQPGSALSSAARLMDVDEEGQSLVEGGRGYGDRDEDEDIPVDLGTGLSRLALTQSSAGLDNLLEPADGDEDDSDNDPDDDSESDEDDAKAASIVRPRHDIQRGGNERSGALTSSSLASVSHSIDEDTLFGIRDPSLNSGAGTTGKSARVNPVPGGQGDGTAKRTSQPSDGQDVGRRTVTATPSTRAYKPMGHVAGLGTVHRGRPLLGEERDDTYSAPSPTPAGASAMLRRPPPSSR